MSKTVELESVPPFGQLYGKAAASMLPGVGKPSKVAADAPLPDTTYSLKEVRVDLDNLKAYCATTGQPVGESLPLTYPFVLQSPLMLTVMTDPTFPFSAVGSVHLENSIERFRRIGINETLSIATHAANLREHRKGILVDVVSVISVEGEVVQRNTATIFHAQRTSLSDSEQSAPPVDKRPPPPGFLLNVNQGLIRRYAAAGGDRNPIHMSGISAKAFGFPQAIAHGAWSFAAVLANLESKLPDHVTYDVKWGKPILLPAKVNGYIHTVKDGYDVELLNGKKGYPYLTGTIRKG